VNVLLLLAHAIEEHDQLKLLSELGYDVFSIGGYINPGTPHDPKRPPLPEVPYHPELQAVVDGLGTPDNLRAAKEHIPDELIDWADTIIVHHYEHTWLVPQWKRIKHKRVIWRTVGQSVEGNERMMAPFHRDGMQIVRYSPKERNIPGYAGEDALIRFYKDPDEWCGWVGDWKLGHSNEGPIVNDTAGYPFVLNFTQHLRQREPYTNWSYWDKATKGLPAVAAGPGSEVIGGIGEQSVGQMQRLLRGARVYLYTGTQPASYTLGLIEAMMTGIPVVSISPDWMDVFPYGKDLFEGHELATDWGVTVSDARTKLWSYIGGNGTGIIEKSAAEAAYARAMEASDQTRAKAIELFGKRKIAAEWKAFLG
jgi:hypothetical protein